MGRRRKHATEKRPATPPRDEAKPPSEASRPVRSQTRSSSSSSSSSTARPISRRKLWAFRIVAALAGPLLLFAVLEVGLRIAGIGYSTEFFQQTADGKWRYPNPEFGKSFFPHWLRQFPQPVSFAFAAEKPADTVRIMVLGESAAQGYPAPAYGFSRVLDVLLRNAYPDVRFEVVNTATVAINSHVILPIARACAEQQPDAVVVYIGNNEVVGPYGAGTVLKGFSPSLWMIRLAIASKRLRVGQLAARLAEGRRDPVEWGGMAMFEGHRVTASSPQLKQVYEHFARNLADICEAVARPGTDVLLCTVPVNLRQSAPFASEHRAGLSGTQLEAWQQHYERGVALEERGDLDGAVAAWREALEMDSEFADLHYRLGQAYLQLGQQQLGEQHLRRALAHDALRFRSDERINETIRQTAEALASQGVQLVDTERVFAEDPLSAHGVAGGELLLEHVHLNFSGNYLFARTVFEQLRETVERRTGKSARVEPLTEQQCAERLALSWQAQRQIYQELLVLMNKPPFTNQLDFRQQHERLSQKVAELQRSAAEETLQDELSLTQEAMAAAPDDLDLRYQLASLESRARQWREAADNLDFILQRSPVHQQARLRICTALNELGEYDRALEHARQLVAQRPDFPAAYEKEGDALMGREEYTAAAERLRRALELQPKRVTARVKLARCLAETDARRDALREYRVVLQLAPNDVDAHRGLAELYEQLGRREDAAKHYAAILQRDPNDANARQRLSALRSN